MKKPYKIFLFFFSLLPVLSCTGPAKNEGLVSRTGPYAGCPDPGDVPQLFAPGFITTGLYERDIAINPVDGNEIFFSVFLGDWVTIMETHTTDEGWSLPEVASFARDTLVNYCEPAFAPDGAHLVFLCTLPLDGSAPRPGWQDQNLWMVNREKDGSWTGMTPLPREINDAAQFFPSIALDGTFYFTRTDTSTQISAIYKTAWPPSRGLNPVRVPPPVNGPGNIYNTCVSPDGSCLVACIIGRDSLVSAKRAVYYAFFKNDDGWSEGKNLSEVLQMGEGNAISPSFSPDGKYFFFATNKRRNELNFSQGAMNLDFFRERRDMPGNGNSDIYWVDASVIYDLKPKFY